MNIQETGLYEGDRPRERQIFTNEDEPLHGVGSIPSLDRLHYHLQTAIEIEHSTIPTYLCALYTINSTTNSFAYQTIQSVVMEEMLHMVLAANILNAIGGHPSIDNKHFVPEYPTYLPHSSDSFLVPLQKFCPDTIDVFLKIEQPSGELAPPEIDHYQTIGQFYEAVKYALRWFDFITPGGIFTGDKERQVLGEHYYGGGGKLIPVYCLADAILAINEIIGQGEGINQTIEDSDHELFGEEIEYAHYFRFNEIAVGKRYLPRDSAHLPPTGPDVAVDWDAALNMQPNPKLADYPEGSPLWTLTMDFNQTYTGLLREIHVACNGSPERFRLAIPMMYDLKYKALALMNTPTGKGTMAGPSFEYAGPVE